MRHAIVFAAALLAGCNGSEESREPSGQQSPRPFAVEGGVDAQRVAPPGRKAGNAAPVFSLLPDGLMVARGEGPVSVLRFGERQEVVVAALRADFGRPRESDNGQCEAGAMRFADFGAIKVNFVDGKFVGWFAESGKGLNAGDGVSPGMTFDQLEKFGAKRALDSTLDGEFDLTRPGGGSVMGGFLGADGKARSLYAGANCFFR